MGAIATGFVNAAKCADIRGYRCHDGQPSRLAFFGETLMLQALLGPISSLAGTWLEGKVETKKAEAASKVAKAKAEATIMEKKATGEIDWDLTMADASKHSWKDEWLTILFSVPLVLAFCGEWGREIVAQGFTALDAMPEYYRYTLGIIVSASFGTRAASKFFGGKK